MCATAHPGMQAEAVHSTHGRRGINRLMLGSDAETVLRHAHCPVLMVRSPDKKTARQR